MCSVNWDLLLEFFKVVASWPLITLAIFMAILIIFRAPISEWIKTINEVEGDILGQKVKISAQKQPKIEHLTDIIEETAKASEIIIETENPGTIYIPEEFRDIPDIEKIVAAVTANPLGAAVVLNQISNKYVFERVFNIIYGTQINILMYLNNSPLQWHDISDISGFYASHKEHLKDTALDQFTYLNFLRAGGLVDLTWGDDVKTIKSTKLTGEFLKYISETYPVNWNLRNF